MHTVSDKIKKLINSDFFFILISQIIYKVGAFCSSIFLARMLLKDDYGLYSYCNNIISVFLLLNGLGTVDAVFQAGLENENQLSTQSAYSFFGLRIGLIGNLCISIAIVIYALFFETSFEGAKTLLLLLAAQPILMYVNNYNITQLRINKKDKIYSVQNALSGIIICVLSIVGAIVFDVLGVVIFQDVAYVIIAVSGTIFAFSNLKNIKERRKLDKSEKKSFVILCLSFVAMILVSHLMTVMDVFVIGKVIKDTEIIADYKVAATIPSALVFLPSSVMIFAYPYFVRHKEDYKWVKRNTILLMLAGLLLYGVIAIAGNFLAEWGLTLIYGEQYIAAAGPFKVLLLSFVFNATINIVISNILVSKRKVIYNVIISAIMGITNIFLNVILITKFGSIGAAYATLLSTILGSILYTVFFLVIMAKQKKMLQVEQAGRAIMESYEANDIIGDNESNE